MTDRIAPVAAMLAIRQGNYENFTISYTTAKTITAVVIALCAGIIIAAVYNYYIRRVPGGVARLLLDRGAISPETALTAAELGLLNKPFALWELLRGTSLRHIVATVNPEKPEDAEDEGTDSPKEIDCEEEDASPSDKLLADGEATADKVIEAVEDEELSDEDVDENADEDVEDEDEDGDENEDEEDTKKHPAPIAERATHLTRFYIPEEKKYRAQLRFAREGNGPIGLAVTVGVTVAIGFTLLKLMPLLFSLIDKFL